MSSGSIEILAAFKKKNFVHLNFVMGNGFQKGCNFFETGFGLKASCVV